MEESKKQRVKRLSTELRDAMNDAGATGVFSAVFIGKNASEIFSFECGDPTAAANCLALGLARDNGAIRTGRYAVILMSAMKYYVGPQELANVCGKVCSTSDNPIDRLIESTIQRFGDN